MTAVAKLRDLAASWRREADDMERAGVSPSTTLAIRANADELTAALSPAELGGVDDAELAEVIADLRELAEVDGWICCGVAADLLESRATPRAAEAVTDEAVYTEEEVAEAMEVLRGRHGSSTLVDEVLDDMERVLRSALTPPSAKGE